jgi:hypothetical protein
MRFPGRTGVPETMLPSVGTSGAHLLLPLRMLPSSFGENMWHSHSATRTWRGACAMWRQRLRAERWLAIAASYACAFAPAAVAIATAAVARRLPPLPPAEHSQAAPDRLSRGHRSAPALRSAHRAWSYFPSYATATVTGQVGRKDKTTPPQKSQLAYGAAPDTWNQIAADRKQPLLL